MFGSWKLAVGGVLLILLCISSPVLAQKIGEKSSPDENRERSKPLSDTNPVSSGDSKPTEDKNSSPEKEEKKAPPGVNYKLRRGEKEIFGEFGSAPFNPTNFNGPTEYNASGREMHLLRIRFGQIIGTKGLVTYQYFFSSAPVAIFTKNEVKNPDFISETETPEVKPTIRQTSWGFGIQPVNFRFLFFPKSRLKPFAQVGAGLLFTNKAVPVPNTRRINFTGDFGGGIQYFATRRSAVTFGYKYFHISNANTGQINPGYNASTFYFGYSFFTR